MINLKSYVVMKEELDADNIQWKFNNWSNFRVWSCAAVGLIALRCFHYCNAVL